MKKTELQRLEDEVSLFEDNRDILNQFAEKFVMSFAKKHEYLAIELQNLEGQIKPDLGFEVHKLTLTVKRRFDCISKAVMCSFEQKQQKQKKSHRDSIVVRSRTKAAKYKRV